MKKIFLLLGAVFLVNSGETTNPDYNDEFNDETHPDTAWTYKDNGKWWPDKSAKVVKGNQCGTGKN